MHHAYLIVGEKDRGIRHARELFSLPEKADNNPDVHVVTHDTLGIEEARQLHQWAYQKPLVSPVRYFILICGGVTHEAQNALLKLFEEPPQTSAFALLVSDIELILPTLRSRFAIIELPKEEIDTKLAQNFLKASASERIEEIGRRMKNRDTTWALDLLKSLEEQLYKDKKVKDLEALLFVRKYMERRGASQKMLLEHLALTF